MQRRVSLQARRPYIRPGHQRFQQRKTSLPPSIGSRLRTERAPCPTRHLQQRCQPARLRHPPPSWPRRPAPAHQDGLPCHLRTRKRRISRICLRPGNFNVKPLRNRIHQLAAEPRLHAVGILKIRQAVQRARHRQRTLVHQRQLRRLLLDTRRRTTLCIRPRNRAETGAPAEPSNQRHAQRSASYNTAATRRHYAASSTLSSSSSSRSASSST